MILHWLRSGAALPEIQGQRYVTRNGSVQDNLPQIQVGLVVATARQRAVPLFDDSCRRVQGKNLDFLADRRGQRELDLPQASLPDVQIELIVHV